MCILFAAIEKHPVYPIIICANRDEFYQRESTQMQWNDREGDKFLSGIDLKAGGTWLGLSELGYFGAVTNIRGSKIQVSSPYSRGELPLLHLKNKSIARTSEQLKTNSNYYQPFNLWFGDLKQRQLKHFNSIHRSFLTLSKGFHTVSNSKNFERWPKMVRGIEHIEKIIESSGTIDTSMLLKVLTDSTQADDRELPNTGISFEWEKRLSSIFIQSEEYGTRACTVILLDHNNNAKVIEQRYGVLGKNLGKSEFDLSL